MADEDLERRLSCLPLRRRERQESLPARRLHGYFRPEQEELGLFFKHPEAKTPPTESPRKIECLKVQVIFHLGSKARLHQRIAVFWRSARETVLDDLRN